jgi:hypothetical protein
MAGWQDGRMAGSNRQAKVRIEIKKVQRLEGEIILPRVPRASFKGIKSKQ